VRRVREAEREGGREGERKNVRVQGHCPLPVCRSGKAPPTAALGALLKAYCLVDNLQCARGLLSTILLGEPSTAQGHSVRHNGVAQYRVLSTYLRLCVRTGNMCAAAEALEV